MSRHQILFGYRGLGDFTSRMFHNNTARGAAPSIDSGTGIDASSDVSAQPDARADAGPEGSAADAMVADMQHD